jgi:hypothetical protein
MKQNLEGPLFTIAGIRLKCRERRSGGDFHPSSYIGLVVSFSLTFLFFHIMCVLCRSIYLPVIKMKFDTLFVYLFATTSQAVATLKANCAKLAPELQ